MFDPAHNPRFERSGDLIWDRKRPLVPGDSLFAKAEDTGDLPKADPMDAPHICALHRNLLGHHIRELDVHAENRQEMATDEDFYDHIQYTEDDLAALAERGQSPVTYNLIQTTVNWVLGSERRAKQDFRILPRKKTGAQAAERKTQLMFHVRDTNSSEYEWSDAFASGVKAGLGWMECAQGFIEDGSIVVERCENWRAMLWDSTAMRYDLQDARYISRSKWVDIDVALSKWPHRRGVIETAARSTVLGVSAIDDIGDEPMDSIEMSHFDRHASLTRSSWESNRDRIRLVEMWFKRPVADAAVIRGGQFNGELFDEWSPGHIADLRSGASELIKRARDVIYVALMTDSGMLDVRRSPYRHNRYPFTPVWGYRRARDGMPYGLIRGVRDIQRDLNRRQSKALHHLSAKTVFVQANAVEDIDELRAEAARPDAVIVYKEGSPAPVIDSDIQLADSHVTLMNLDASMIQQVGGVTDENMGRKTNAVSGKAIHARQDQGQLATSIFFDNLRRSRLAAGEKLLVLIEQFYTAADEIRVTDSRGNADFKPINDGAPENAIASHKADFIISEEDWRASARQAQAEQILDLAQKLAATAPQLVVAILDLVVEMLDVPKRDELVKRIRQLTGQPDPDADPNNPDPQTIAMQQQKAIQDQMQMRQAEAALAESEAKARKTTAEAAKAEAGIGTDYIAALKAAMETAIAIAGAPAVAAAADQVMADAISAASAAVAPPISATPEPAMMGA